MPATRSRGLRQHRNAIPGLEERCLLAAESVARFMRTLGIAERHPHGASDGRGLARMNAARELIGIEIIGARDAVPLAVLAQFHDRPSALAMAARARWCASVASTSARSSVPSSTRYSISANTARSAASSSSRWAMSSVERLDMRNRGDVASIALTISSVVLAMLLSHFVMGRA